MPGRKRLQQSGTDGGINPELLVLRSEAGRVRNVIQKLTPPYRMVLVLRDMEGFSDEEVAAITGLRSGTVRVRLHRARLLVRKELMKAVKPSGGKAAAVSRASVPAQPGPLQSHPRRTLGLSRRQAEASASPGTEAAPEKLPALPGVPGQSQGHGRAMPQITCRRPEPQANRQTAIKSPGRLRTHDRKKPPPLIMNSRGRAPILRKSSVVGTSVVSQSRVSVAGFDD